MLITLFNKKTFRHLTTKQSYAQINKGSVFLIHGVYDGRKIELRCLLIDRKVELRLHYEAPRIQDRLRFALSLQQELSCHIQIARQLRTQYAEGISDNPMTLKSRLTVTQDH